MPKLKVRHLPLLALAAIAGLCALPLLKDKDPALLSSALVGKPHPATPALPADGRPFLVNFFASWCVPCAAEQRTLNALAKEGIVIRGIAYKDKEQDLKAWLKRYGNPYTDLSEDKDGRTALEWGITGVPETFVIDGQGIVRYRWQGPLTREAFQNNIVPVLAEMKK